MTQLRQLYEKEKIEYANQKVRENAKEIARLLLEDGSEIVKIVKGTGGLRRRNSFIFRRKM